MSAKTEPSKGESIPLKTLATDKTDVLHPDDTVEVAGARMRKHDAEAWPVADDRKLVGMIDEKNPDWKVGGHGHDPNDSRVSQIMSRDLIFCYEDEDCAVAQKVMDERGLTYLPVVDREMRIVGVFNRKEIAEMASGDAERQEIARRAMQLAREDGRTAYTDDDLSRAKAEVAEGRKTE